MDREAGVLNGLLSALGRDRVLLVGEAFAGKDLAVLEYDSSVPEHEVDGACDLAFAVELALGVGVESVLVPVKSATVEYREVGVGPEGDRLVLFGPGRVFERYVPGYEPLTFHSCHDYFENINKKVWLDFISNVIVMRIHETVHFCHA